VYLNEELRASAYYRLACPLQNLFFKAFHIYLDEVRERKTQSGYQVIQRIDMYLILNEVTFVQYTRAFAIQGCAAQMPGWLEERKDFRLIPQSLIDQHHVAQAVNPDVTAQAFKAVRVRLERHDTPVCTDGTCEEKRHDTHVGTDIIHDSPRAWQRHQELLLFCRRMCSEQATAHEPHAGNERMSRSVYSCTIPQMTTY